MMSTAQCHDLSPSGLDIAVIETFELSVMAFRLGAVGYCLRVDYIFFNLIFSANRLERLKIKLLTINDSNWISAIYQHMC